ncbi:S41 family peptidase, partial [Fulvivirga lutimaris]|uniref:S41 family peptidase n=1 Tax=Fulvivirga lutimaris TaxID=1819566 RepID=UPI001C87FA68
ENGKVYENPIVILVNELTQSQAEFTAMAFSTVKNSLVVGSQTTGADGNANKFELPGGFPTMFTGIGIFYPDGTQTQRIGIKLDKEIHQTAEQIRNGEDPLMEYGLNYILKY